MTQPRQPSAQALAAMQALQLRAWSSALTVRIARIEGARETAWNTASGVLLEIEGRAVIGTAWHVLANFRARRAAGEDLALICDNMPILDPRTVYRDEGADIALLEVPRKHRSRIDAVPYRPGTAWPPPQVKVEDSVLLCAFPRLFRHDGDEILHGDLNLLLEVGSTADKHFMLQVEWESLIQAGRVRLAPGQYDFSGASGGPVFLYDGGCNPLVGVVSEAGENLPLWRIASLASLPTSLKDVASEPV